LSQVSATPPACNACIISQLTIRDIDDGLKRALRVREILRTALGMPSPED